MYCRGAVICARGAGRYVVQDMEVLRRVGDRSIMRYCSCIVCVLTFSRIIQAGLHSRHLGHAKCDCSVTLSGIVASG